MSIKVSTYTDTTDLLTGNVTINIKVPGTFGGTDPSVTGFQGRRLKKIGLWLEGRGTGDKLTSLCIKDVDSILPAPYTGAVLNSLIDTTVPTNNKAITLPPGGQPFQLDFPTDPSDPAWAKAIVPSGLYLVVKFQKGSIGVDTAVVNVAWDDFS